MEEYKCYRCNKVLKSAYNLSVHMKKKKPCNVEITISPNENNSYKCVNCMNTYKYASGLSKHKKKCNASVIVPAEMTRIIRNMQTEITALKASKSANNSINNTITNTNNNTTINNITINGPVILSAKECKIEELLPQVPQLIKRECRWCIKPIIVEVYFNPNLPENHSIQASEKKNHVLIYENEEWQEMKYDDARKFIWPIIQMIVEKGTDKNSFNGFIMQFECENAVKAIISKSENSDNFKEVITETFNEIPKYMLALK